MSYFCFHFNLVLGLGMYCSFPSSYRPCWQYTRAEPEYWRASDETSIDYKACTRGSTAVLIGARPFQRVQGVSGDVFADSLASD